MGINSPFHYNGLTAPTNKPHLPLTHLECFIVVRCDSEARDETIDHKIDIMLHELLSSAEHFEGVEEKGLEERDIVKDEVSLSTAM